MSQHDAGLGEHAHAGERARKCRLGDRAHVGFIALNRHTATGLLTIGPVDLHPREADVQGVAGGLPAEAAHLGSLAMERDAWRLLVRRRGATRQAARVAAAHAAWRGHTPCSARVQRCACGAVPCCKAHLYCPPGPTCTALEAVPSGPTCTAIGTHLYCWTMPGISCTSRARGVGKSTI